VEGFIILFELVPMRLLSGCLLPEVPPPGVYDIVVHICDLLFTRRNCKVT